MPDSDWPILKARPTRLQEAVDALPMPKGSRTKARRPIAQLRAQLLERSVEQLSQQRMTHKAREVLPYLAVETRNPELRKRIVAMTTLQVGEMRWGLLSQMIPYLWEEEPLRQAAFERAKTDPPQQGPRWLKQHWHAALGASNPPQALARLALKEEPILSRVLGHLEIREGSPLGQAVISATLDLATDEWLGLQPYTETLRTIEHSTTDPALRMRLLALVLDRYLRDTQSWQLFSGGPMLELMEVSHSILRGWPDERPGPWQKMPNRAKEIGRRLHFREQLDELFPAERADPMNLHRTWQRLLPWVKSMQVQRSKGWMTLQIGHHIFLEQIKQPHRCLIYPVTGWWRIWRELKHQPTESTMPEAMAIFERNENWKPAFDRLLVDHHGVPADLDTIPTDW